MKRILLITHSSNITGGAEDDFERLLKRLYSSDKYEIHVACPEGQRVESFSRYSHKIHLYRWGWFPVINDNLIPYLKYLIKYFWQHSQFKNIFSKYHFDLCIINVCVLLWPIAFVRKRTKTLVFIRETILPGWIRRFYYKILSKNISYLFAVSEFNRLDYAGIVKSNNIDTLYSSIENETPGDIANSDLKDRNDILNLLRNSDIFKILLVGGFSERKNQLMALEAVNYIVNELNEKNISLLFAGNSSIDNSYGLRIRKFIKINNIDNYVCFLGVINKSTMLSLHSYINSLLITSTSEGLPLVLAEALRYKTPIISTKCGGILDVIKDRWNGAVINFDYEELGKTILELKSDNNYCNYLSANGYETYEKVFSLENNLKRFEEAVESLAESKF